MRHPFVIFVAALALSSCGNSDPTVSDAVVRLPVIAGRPGAAYFTVTGGAEPDRLVSVDTPAAATVELHEGGMSGGMMTMRRIDGVDVPANGKAVFAPGGNHAMLFGMKPALKPGDTVPLRFHFASGKEVAVEGLASATVAVGNSH
jgi:copper(I)-binding protein